MTEVQISFPGLGIDTFTVNKVAFQIFGLEVRWYGVLITLGMILAFAYAMYRSKQENFKYDEVLDMGLYIVIFGVLGARLYYVLMKWDTFVIPGRSLWENLKSLMNIRGGGLAIYGGVIAGALTIIVYSKIKKKSWLSAWDMVAPGVMIAQALGRWGNFFNGEAYGGIVAENHVLYFMRMGLYPNDLLAGQMAYVHPTFLYESLWNILGFLLIHFLVYPHKKFNGQVAMSYFAWYGFGRMFIEGLRTDSLYIGGVIRVSQCLGGLCFVCFTAAIVYILIRTKKNAQIAGDTYIPMYADLAEATAPTPEEAHAEEQDGNDPADTETKNEVSDAQREEDENNGMHH